MKMIRWLVQSPEKTIFDVIWVNEVKQVKDQIETSVCSTRTTMWNSGNALRNIESVQLISMTVKSIHLSRSNATRYL